MAVFRTGFNGNGIINQYQKQGVLEHTYDNLVLPRTEDGAAKTIATQEWTQGEISGKVDTNDLSAYLPLSGGTMLGGIEIPNPYALSVGTYQLQDKDFDGFQIDDGWDFWKFGGSSEQPNDVMRRMDISAFIKATAMT